MRYRVLVAGTIIGLVVGGAMPLASAGGGGVCPDDGTVTERRGTTVLAEDFCFRPSVLEVDSGTEVRFENADPLEHVVLGASTRWGDWNLKQGEDFSYRFDEPGVYPFQCYLHPGMTGAIVVGDGGRTEAVAADAGAAAPPPLEEAADGDVTLGGLFWAIGLAAVAMFAIAAALSRRSPRSTTGG